MENGEAGVHRGVEAALGHDGALLARERRVDEEEAVLENGGGHAKDEVDGGSGAAAAVELAKRVHV